MVVGLVLLLALMMILVLTVLFRVKLRFGLIVRVLMVKSRGVCRIGCSFIGRICLVRRR